MQIEHIRAPQPCVYDRPVIFLAGPIQGSSPWQDAAAEYLEHHASRDLIIANPRREEWATEGFVYSEQVNWESQWLKNAGMGELGGCVLFWLPLAAEHVEGRSYAQTTRFELAEWITLARHGLGRPAVVGIEPGFSGERYVRHRSEGTGVEVFSTLEDTVAAALARVEAS